MQITQVHRTEQEKVFITVQNNEGDQVLIGEILEFAAVTTDADQGRLVNVVDATSNLTTGIGAKVAGVVVDTIATGAVGRIQVYGPCEVRAGTTIAASVALVAGTTNAEGSASAVSNSTAVGASYVDSVIGWAVEASPNATTVRAFISTL
jgi:hypothetical protein